MITKIDVINSRSNVLTLSMIDDDTPYVVNSIDGLEPVQATLTSTSYVGEDGEVFQSAKRAARNIKIAVDLDPDFITSTYTTLRQDLYPFFIPKSQIRLRFYEDTGLYLDITGVVEEFTSPLFEQNPTVTVSIMCYQPDFTDPRIIQVEGHTVSDTTNTVIDYPGSVESGTVVTFTLNHPMTEFSIYNTDEGGNRQQLDFTGDLHEDDILVVSSLKGAKGITLTRAGVSSSYLYGRSAQSSWIELAVGLNNFRIFTPGDPVPYVLEYVVRYGGL